MVGDANVTGDSGADTHPCGEVASTLIVLSSGHHRSFDSSIMVLVCRALIGMSCKLAAYITQAE